MKNIIAFSMICLAPEAMSSGQSGGTPPALADLSQEIMMAAPGRAGIFDKGAGDIGLLAKGELLPTLSITKVSLQAKTNALGSLSVSDNDFSLLSSRSEPLDAIGIKGESASYRIEAGETLDSVILKDRRDLARAAVKK